MLEERDMATTTTTTTLDVTEEAALVHKFDNNVTLLNHNDYGAPDGTRLPPLRPYTGDCPHYLRTGTCKFGLNCKFNHPLRTTHQDVQGKGKERANEGFSSDKTTEQVQCKYYLKEGGCKYGESCRYSHSKAQPGNALMELNFLGLPIRLGGKACPFYMRTGTCSYGVRCLFHHPNPTTEGGSNGPSLSDGCMGQFGSSGTCNGIYLPLNLSGASTVSQPGQASWDVPIFSRNNAPYVDNHSSYMPSVQVHSLPQGVHQSPECRGYQVPNYPQERTKHPHLAPGANASGKTEEVVSKADEFPERPGLPECDHFMKTGDCKFKSACWYHHPKNRASKADVCVLSDKGLPIRPGRKICRHYDQLGICKYGRACLFDHPVNLHSSASSAGPVSQFPGGSAGTVGGSRITGCRNGNEATIKQSV